MQTNTKHGSLLGKVMKVAIPLIITVGLCWLMFKHIDYRQMLDIIRHQCSFGWIGLALFISIFSHVFRAMRWNIQLSALGVHAPLHILVYSIFGTYAINLLFPRLGEVWRCGYIAQRQKSPFSTVFGSMIADRLSDTVTVLLLLIFTFLLASRHIMEYMSQNHEAYEKAITVATSPWLWLAVAACLAFAWWFLTRKGKQGSFFFKVQQFVKGLWKGFAVLGTMPGKGKWLLFTFCIWGCYFLQMYVAFFAFPFTTNALHTYGIVVVLVTFVLSSVAMGVPSNGGIGPWQWAVMFALSFYGVDHTDSLTFGNLLLGTSTLLLILLGIFTAIAIMLDRKNHNQISNIRT